MHPKPAGLTVIEFLVSCMPEVSEAQAILAALGMPSAQHNEMAALTVLALCGLKSEEPYLQIGTSHPLYCTRLVDPVTDSWFAARWWYFVKVPDVMYIHFSRLFSPDPIQVPD